MAYDARFGPTAQTPALRAWVLEQMQAVQPHLKAKVPTFARLSAVSRYVAGELSRLDVRQPLTAA